MGLREAQALVQDLYRDVRTEFDRLVDRRVVADVVGHRVTVRPVTEGDATPPLRRLRGTTIEPNDDVIVLRVADREYVLGALLRSDEGEDRDRIAQRPRAGLWIGPLMYGAGSAGAGTRGFAESIIMAIPFDLPDDIDVNGLACNVPTAVVGGEAYLYLFADRPELGEPGVTLMQGAVTTDPAGQKTITRQTVRLEGGHRYWLGIGHNGGPDPAAPVHIAFSAAIPTRDLIGSASPLTMHIALVRSSQVNGGAANVSDWQTAAGTTSRTTGNYPLLAARVAG